MTDLDRQAIRDYATNALSLGMYNAYFNMAAVVALLDALEAAERERDARTVERDTWRER